MKSNKMEWKPTESPEDIAGAMVYKLYYNNLSEEKCDEIRVNIQKAVEWLEFAAENDMNMEGFRYIYSALEDLKNDIEEEIPFWDRDN